MGGDTDPAMTAAGSTTTRGSGFFGVSLESGRKVGKNRRQKVERSLQLSTVAIYAKPKPCKTTPACLSPNGCHKHLEMLAALSTTAGLIIYKNS